MKILFFKCHWDRLNLELFPPPHTAISHQEPELELDWDLEIVFDSQLLILKYYSSNVDADWNNRREDCQNCQMYFTIQEITLASGE